MSEIIYLDTNIYLDCFEGRVDKLRPLGEFAFQLIRRTIGCEFKIAISNHLIRQIEYNNQLKQFNQLIQELEKLNKIIKIEFNDKDEEEANKLRKERKIHFEDCLHAILARKTGAIFIVTRNMKDFQELQDIIKPIFPETL